MRHSLAAQINNLITLLILVIVGITPLLFSSVTTEYFETPKLILLVAGTLILVLLWVFSWVLQGKVLLTKTPLDLPLLLLLVVVVISTLISDSRYVSIFGNFPRIHGSATAMITYILFYFVAASHIKTVSQVRALLYALLISSTIVAILTVLSYLGFYLPLPFAKAANFTLTGSSFSTAALLLLLLPYTFLNITNPNKQISSIAAVGLASLFMATIVLIGGNNNSGFAVLLSPIFLALYLTVALSIYIIRKHHIDSFLPLLAIPILISVIVFVLGYLPIGNNPFNDKRVNFPREIQLPFATSWQVSGQSFVKSPFFGSGPATYLFNFTSFKPVDFNTNKFWNLRFDQAFNEYLQILGTLGSLGFLAFLVLTIIIASFSWSTLRSHHNNLEKSLSISGLVAVLLLLVHTSSPVFMVAVMAFLAMLMGINKQLSGKVEELTIGIKASKLTDSPTMQGLIVGDILPILIFIPVMLFVIWGFWNLSQSVAADYYHRKALNSASTSGIDTYRNLQQAETLNNKIDLYRTDLAQTNFALANAIAAAKGPTEASPGGSLSDKDKSDIQTLLSQAITEGRVATVLSPRSAANWEILASIYRQISGVAQNALDFSLDGYGRAIQRDPLNPTLRLNVGGIYYSVKNYELATRFFADAANLKPDYANAYYNLSITLRDKGDLKGAVAVAQQVVSLLQSDTKSPDYQTASRLLSDLKDQASKTASGSAQITPPAAAQNSALQKDNLPNVVDLGQKPQVATPEAVKKNPKATPQPSAQP